MKTQYAAPSWATNIIKFIRSFFNSVKALFDVVWNLGDSIVGGVDHVATTIFSAMGRLLNPIIACKVFIFMAVAVTVWGLWSWMWMGVTLLGALGMDPIVAGFIGLVLGITFNFVEIVPELGTLFLQYAQVFGRSGKPEEKIKYTKWSVTASNFNEAQLDQLDSARNIACALEFGISGYYSFVVNAFTKVVKTKAGTMLVAKGFWPIIGTIVWCWALVKLPEYSWKMAAALVHTVSRLPKTAYQD